MAGADLQVDNGCGLENLNSPWLNFKSGEVGDPRSEYLDCGLGGPVNGPGRQNRDVRPRHAIRDQFPAQVVEKSPQGIWYVRDERETVDRLQPVIAGRHHSPS
jgi:hypothetical protein